MAIFHHRDSEAFTKGLLGVVGVGLLVGAASCSEDVVNVVPVERVQLSPAGDTITQHEHIEFSVTASDGEGRQLQGRDVEWAVEPASLGTINEGEFSPAEVGDGQIRATVEGVSGAADVAVLFQAEVQGSVTHAGSGDPVEGAVVTGAHPYQGGSLFEVESDEAGRYEADFLLEEQVDDIVIEVEAAGYQSVNDEASLEETINLDVELDLREYELAVDVEPEEGGDVDPAAGTFEHGTEVEVEAKSEDGYAFSHWTGDLSGGNNPLSFVMDSHVDATAVFEFVGFHAEVSGSVVEHATGEPIEGAIVSGTDADTGESLFDVHTDGAGEYEASVGTDERPSEIVVEADAEGYESASEVVPFEGEKSVDFTLVRKGPAMPELEVAAVYPHVIWYEWDPPGPDSTVMRIREEGKSEWGTELTFSSGSEGAIIWRFEQGNRYEAQVRVCEDDHCSRFSRSAIAQTPTDPALHDLEDAGGSHIEEGDAGFERYYHLRLDDVGGSARIIDLSVESGEVSMYVSRFSLPTQEEYGCGGSRCRIPGEIASGEFYILLVADTDFSDAVLTVELEGHALEVPVSEFKFEPEFGPRSRALPFPDSR